MQTTKKKKVGASLLAVPFFMGIALASVAGVLGITAKGAIAATLTEIQDRGYLIVGVKNNRPPLGFTDAAGNLLGFEIEIAQRLAEELLGNSTAVQLVPVSNVDRLNAVIEDRVDIAIAAITLTEPRRRIINFSDPYYLDGVAFITQQQGIRQLNDLSTANIAILDRSSSVAHVRYILPFAQLVAVTSYAEGRQLLAEGRVDAFAGDASVLSGWLGNDRLGYSQFGDVQLDDSQSGDGQLTTQNLTPVGSDYRLLESILSAEPLSVAIPKGTQYDSLKAAINESLRQWYDEGWLQERAAAWGLPAESAQFIEPL